MRLRDLSPSFEPALPLRLILLTAFGARLYQLGEQSLWYDEAVSLFIAQKSVPGLIAHTAGDIHPPLYYFLLHFWLGAAGVSEFAGAFFSLFFGVLLVALGYRLARDWFGVNAGTLTAFLLMLSSFNLWHSQEARMYTLVACLALLSLWLLARFWDCRFAIAEVRFWIYAAAYIATIAAGLYTHYYFVFLWVFQFLYVVALLLIEWLQAHPIRLSARMLSHAVESATNRIANRRISLSAVRRVALWLARKPLTIWCALQVGVVALFAPWLQTAIRQVTEPPVPPWRSFVSWDTALLETVTALAFGQSMPTHFALLLMPAVLIVYAGGLAAWLWRARGETFRRIDTPPMLFGAVGAPFILVVALSNVAPLYHVRYMFIYGIAFYVGLGLSYALIGRRALLAMLLLLGIQTGGSLYADYQRRASPVYAKDDYRSAVRYIAERARPGDAVLVNAGYIYPVFVYYYPNQIGWRGRLSDYRGDEDPQALVVAQTGSLDASPSLGWGSPDSDFFATDEAATARALDLLMRKHPRLWVLRANDTVNDPRGFIREYLKKNAVMFAETTARGESFVKAQGFLAQSPGAATIAPTTPVRVTLGQRISLLGWSSPPTVTANSRLPLTLYWQALAPLDVDYHVSVGLYDAQGRRWAATDGMPVGALLPSGDWAVGQVLPDAWNLTIPLGTPPGEYGLQVTLYDPATYKPLPVPNGAEGVRARLGAIEVLRAVDSAVGGWWTTYPVFDGGLALVEHKVSGGPLKPGEAIHAELLWRATSNLADDQLVFLNLLDERGRLWATHESAPVEGRYPTSRWKAGEHVRDTHDLLIPPDAPDGRYRVMAGLVQARNRERLNVRPGLSPFVFDSLELATIEVKGRERVMQAPTAIKNRARARFGENALLIGYDVQIPASAPSARLLTVTLYWHALSPMKTNHKVFVHLVGANQQIVAQRDSEPGDGALPTTGWLEGEYLTDTYLLELRPDLPPGEYAIYIGFYDPRTSARLPIYDVESKPAGDRWLLRVLTLP